MQRFPVVGVMGSGSEENPERAAALGRWLARQGVHLLTGGGAGVMESVSRAFAEEPNRSGLVVGVVPGEVDESGYSPVEGYPNPWIELAIRTHLPLRGAQGAELGSRNHINVLSSDMVIALPGSAGTASEVRLALRYERPLVCWLSARDEIPGLPDEAQVVGTLAAVQAFVRQQISSPRP